MFRFELSPSSATPLYRQIVDQVTRAVAAGVLVAGDDLPSVRAVAQDYVINPMTVSKAYSLLEQRGVVDRRRGMGMAVSAQAAAGLSERLTLLQPALDRAAAIARQLGISDTDAATAFQQSLAATSQTAATNVKNNAAKSPVVTATEKDASHD